MGRHKALMYLTKRFSIRAIHTLPSEVDSSGQLLIHGHDCYVDVTLKGHADAQTGMLLSRDLIDQEVLKVLSKYDKKNLNHLLSVPSGESLCQAFWDELSNTNIKNYLARIELIETSKNTFIISSA